MTDSTDPEPLRKYVERRADSAFQTLVKCHVSLGERFISIAPGTNTASAAKWALQSFCLLRLNLNELIYVD